MTTQNAVQIAASIANEAAGQSYSVTRLADALGRLGVTSEVFSLDECRADGSRVASRPDRACAYAARYFQKDFDGVPGLSRLGLSQSLNQAISVAARNGALLHVHGLWLMPNVYPGWAARRYRTPLIVSPRGMLGAAALNFSRNRKRAMWALLQRGAFSSVACFHVTSEQELEDVRAFGLRAPVAVVPNGIDIPPDGPRPVSGGRQMRTVLHLGRIHPKKGIEQLIRAWARVAADQPDWRLRIVGPSEGGHGAELETLAHQLGLPRYTIEGPLFGEVKLAAYREADVFVLPTLNENFGMVVAEALAAGTPVISTVGAPWRGLRDNRCGWWVEHGVEPLAAALEEAMHLSPSDLAARGIRGRNWMARDFGWDRIGSEMLSVYEWCRNRGPKPMMVFDD